MNEARENPLVPGEKAKNPTGDFVLVWEDRVLWGVGGSDLSPHAQAVKGTSRGPWE